MLCSNAKHLVALDTEGLLTQRQQRALQAHLSSCARCAYYAQRMNDTLFSIVADAREGTSEPISTTAFEARLHTRLLQERNLQDNRPIAVIQQYLERLMSGNSLTRALAVAGMAAVMFAIAYLGCTFSADQYQQGNEAACGTSHLASFSVKHAPDGRVYASLHEHNVPGRCYQKRNLQ